ncbi:hypothetical protein CP533_0820 [Ophiocordyceps camponoti-saundersi (nom. inval.)]|nr:hypothetical protein CP533_0820 [Ophiocordyceps camponoti-saundersi (nom. inval.)]
MKPHILLSAIVAATTTLFAEAKDQRTFAVLRFTNKQLTKGRMDPIRTPGKTGAHVHNILGGSAFSLTSDGHHLATSNCSTAKVKGDNSNYWFPSLYFKDPKTNKFEDVELFYANAYYFFEATNDDIKPFPLGLSVVSGDIDTRSAPAGGAITNLDASKGPVNPVKWTCPRNGNVYNPPSWPADSDGKLAGIGDPVNKGEGVGFPDVDCDGFASPLRADIHFPSCYDPAVGLTDYKKNMVFPSGAGDGKMDCPKGHIHVPHLFLEIYWNTPAFKDRWVQGQGKQPFVLSNGDATGFSLHADFMAGWDEKVLQHIIDTCDAGTIGMDKCPGLPYGLNQDDCTIPSAIDEKVDGVLDSLPGSNQIAGWSYGGGSRSGGGEGGAAPVSSKPAQSSSAYAPVKSPSYEPVQSSSSYEPAQSSSSYEPTQSSSSYESASSPSTQEPDYYPSSSSSSSEDAAETRYKLPVNQVIGASTESQRPSATKEAVRYHVPTRGLTKHYANSTAHQTNSIGSEAAPSASSSPYSAPSSASSSSYAADSSAVQPTISSECITKTVTVQETVTVTMKGREAAPKGQEAVSQGRQEEAPKGQVAAVMTDGPKFTNSTRSIKGYKYAGCFQDGQQRALSDVIRADMGGVVSNAKCIDYCRASGHALAGTEYGGECYCGDALVGSKRLDEARCNMACEGGICGGSWALSVYSRDGQAIIKASNAAANNATSSSTTAAGTYKGRRHHFHDHVRRRRSPHH